MKLRVPMSGGEWSGGHLLSGDHECQDDGPPETTLRQGSEDPRRPRCQGLPSWRCSP